jgi:mannose-6-phosphate isomerase-like protein (cupin superfamily)
LLFTNIAHHNEFVFHKNYVIEGSGALVNRKGEEQPLKAGDFALVNPEGLAKQSGTRSTNIETRVMCPSR